MTRKQERHLLLRAANRIATKQDEFICHAIRRHKIRPKGVAHIETVKLAQRFASFFDKSEQHAFFQYTAMSPNTRRKNRLIGLAMFIELEKHV